MRELAQLNYSTPGCLMDARARLRWLKRYLDVRRLRRADHNALIRGIRYFTARIAAHDRRRQQAHRPEVISR